MRKLFAGIAIECDCMRPVAWSGAQSALNRVA